MDKRKLGNTGLTVSAMGMGTGGHSRLGQSYGNTIEQSVNIIRAAIDNGVNFIDSAEAYNTEEIVGKAISHYNRESLIVSTKLSTAKPLVAADVEKRLDTSLKKLKSDYVDIYHLHGVKPNDYDYLLEKIYPEMLKLKEKGKIRHIGITETFSNDPTHEMLKRAVADDIWEVILVGFNFVNFSTCEDILDVCMQKGIGTLNMFAIRKKIAVDTLFTELINKLHDQSLVNKEDVKISLNEIFNTTDIESIQELGYRFCLTEKRLNCILSGTGNIEHLENNIKYFNKGGIDKKYYEQIRKLFYNVKLETCD